MQSLNHRCDIWTDQAVGTNGRQQLAQSATNVPCLIIPMDPRAAVIANYSIGKAFNAFFAPGTLLTVGQQLRWNGRKLTIKGVDDYTGFGAVSHVNVACTEVS